MTSTDWIFHLLYRLSQHVLRIGHRSLGIFWERLGERCGIRGTLDFALLPKHQPNVSHKGYDANEED